MSDHGTPLLGIPSLKAEPWLTETLTMIVRRYGREFISATLVSTLLITCLALALPIALLHLYDRVLPNAAYGTLLALTLGVVMALVTETLLRIVRIRILSRVAAVSEAQVHRVAISRLLHASGRILDQRGNGYYAERLAAIGALREAWSGPTLQAMLDLPFVALYGLALWFIAGPLVVALLILVVLLVWLVVVAGLAVRRATEALNLAEERRFNFLFDALRAIQTIKILGAEQQFERRYERLQGSSAQLRRSASDAIGAGAELGALSASLFIMATTGFGALLVLQGDLTMGGLSAATMLAGRGMQPLLGAIGLWCRLQSLATARSRLGELAQLPDERRAGEPLLVPAGEIRLERVCFRPQARGGHLFDGIDVSIMPGTLVGLCGVNGSGRSSLLQLMAGEEAPDSGRVMIDGQDLAQTQRDVAGRIALVPAGTTLVQGTLLQNMTLHDAAAEHRAISLGRRLGLDAVAGGLPQGWHTPVGPGAHPLSRGIATRIGILRALLTEPRILLLDDVTADIDADGDALLRQMLTVLKGSTTVVIATHRRSVLALADCVLMLENGCLRDGR